MKLKTLSIVIACLFTGVAMADNQPYRSGSAPVSFESLDKNGDGVISKDEAKADRTVTKQWKQLDADKDGKLSRSEYDAGTSAGGTSGSGAGSSGSPNTGMPNTPGSGNAGTSGNGAGSNGSEGSAK